MGRSPVDIKIVNGTQGDPATYGFFPRTGEGVLFDLGSLDRLPHRELLRIRHVFVSHTHIDHFIGFDRLLRVNVPHKRMIHMYGPPGFIANVRGKLAGYVWNLLEPEQLSFGVHELDDAGHVTSVTISNTHRFEPRPLTRQMPRVAPVDPPLPKAPAAWLATLEDGTRVEGVVLDHGTPTLAFLCQSPCRYTVAESELAARGLEPGPWIRDLQIAMANEQHEGTIEAGGRTWTVGELGAAIMTASAPRPLGYVTDIAFSRSNIERIAQTLPGADLLISEAVFRDSEVGDAALKKHLTTRQAALIAAFTKAKRMKVFHVSNIYTGSVNEVLGETKEFFETFCRMDQKTLVSQIDAELDRIAQLPTADR